MNIIYWILIILAIFVIGVVVIAKFVIKKGHKGYIKTRDTIRERRESRQVIEEPTEEPVKPKPTKRPAKRPPYKKKK